MIRQAHLIVVVGVLLMGCAVLLVGCSGVGSEAPEEEQGHTEATKEQARSPEATASEDAQCEGTRTFKHKSEEVFMITNDVPGCPKGGLLSGTDGPNTDINGPMQDGLYGGDGADEVRGLGAIRPG